MKKERIAIIGGGIGGLASAYLLNDLYDVTVFEKQNRIGGNAYTFKTKTNDLLDVSVFLYSTVSYPNFFKLLAKLGFKDVAPKKTLLVTGAYQNIDTKQTTLVTGIRNAFISPVIWKTLFVVLRSIPSMRRAFKMEGRGEFEGKTLEESFAMAGVSKSTSMLVSFPIALSSSMIMSDTLGSPAKYFFGKMRKHFAGAKKSQSWKLIKIRSKAYIDALAKPLANKIRLNSDIDSVIRNENGVNIRMADSSTEAFDKVVFACNADQALELMAEPSDEEQRLLGAWRYQPGAVLVHTDKTLFPKNEKHWGIYEYLYSTKDGKLNTSINAAYRKQIGMPKDSDYLGTQHPNYEIDESKTEFKQVFRTPIFDENSLASRDELPSLNGKNRSYFCGSHFGWGIHEDAIKSAVELSEMLGAEF